MLPYGQVKGEVYRMIRLSRGRAKQSELPTYAAALDEIAAITNMRKHQYFMIQGHSWLCLACRSRSASYVIMEICCFLGSVTQQSKRDFNASRHQCSARSSILAQTTVPY